MTEDEKKKLFNYFYPNEKIKLFLFNSFYKGLSNNISDNVCIKNNNILDLSYEKKLVCLAIKDVISRNCTYQKQLTSLYKTSLSNIYENIDYFLNGYVFFLSITRDYFKYIDVFSDRRSICYSTIPIYERL